LRRGNVRHASGAERYEANEGKDAALQVGHRCQYDDDDSVSEKSRKVQGEKQERRRKGEKNAMAAHEKGKR
jgi:hypothetical protein